MRMTAEKYEKMTERLRRNPQAVSCIGKLNQALTAATYAAYAVLLISQAAQKNALFWKVLLVPAAGFAGVTIFRKLYNAPRPCEVLDIEPLLARRKKGESFPSRHVFSIFMIAMACLQAWTWVGVLFFGFGVLLAWTRVIGGVHFPRDVIAGALIAAAWGIVGFYVL